MKNGEATEAADKAGLAGMAWAFGPWEEMEVNWFRPGATVGLDRSGGSHGQTPRPLTEIHGARITPNTRGERTSTAKA